MAGESEGAWDAQKRRWQKAWLRQQWAQGKQLYSQLSGAGITRMTLELDSCDSEVSRLIKSGGQQLAFPVVGPKLWMSNHLVNNTHNFIQQSEDYFWGLESMKRGPLPGQISVLWITLTSHTHLRNTPLEHWSLKMALGGVLGEEGDQPRLLN